MPIKKSYAEHGDACASAHGIELIGDVWTYPVLRELFLGPKRFSELSALLHGVTPAVLTARLRELEARGMLIRTDSTPANLGAVYQLTSWGHALERPLEGVARWAQDSATWDASGGLTPDAAILAMKTMITRPAPRGVSASLRLKLFDKRCPRPQEYSYAVDLDDAGLVATREPQTRDDVDFSCDSTQWTRHLFGTPAATAYAEAAFPDRVTTFIDAYRATLDSGSA